MKNFKIELKWALIFIVMSLLWMVLERLVGLHDKYIHLHQYITMLYMIPAIWMYVLAIKDKKLNFYNGTISYKQILQFGFILTLLISVCGPVTQWITSFVITPNYFQNAKQYAVENKLLSQSDADIQFSYKYYAFHGTLMGFFMGILSTVILGIFLKSKK